jgi:hypothetical protein
MMTILNKSDQMEKDQQSAGRHIYSKLLVLVGRGTMVLAVCSLLLGCGSDSTPKGAAKGNNVKAAAGSKALKTQGTTSLLVGKEETGPKGTIKHHPESKFIELPSVSQEELEARDAEDRRVSESPDTEVWPGMTRAQYEAAQAADKGFDPKTAEVWPGMTRAQYEAAQAADKGFDPKTAEVWPGMTRAQYEAAQAADKGFKSGEAAGKE